MASTCASPKRPGLVGSIAPTFSEREEQFRAIILMDPADTWMERVLLSPHLSNLYAERVMLGPWPEGEATILQDSNVAFRYAKNCIRGRWLPAEPIIISAEMLSFAYATEVLGQRWPEAEARLCTDSRLWPVYVSKLFPTPCPEQEDLLAEDLGDAVVYAQRLFHDPSMACLQHIDEMGNDETLKSMVIFGHLVPDVLPPTTSWAPAFTALWQKVTPLFSGLQLTKPSEMRALCQMHLGVASPSTLELESIDMHGGPDV